MGASLSRGANPPAPPVAREASAATDIVPLNGPVSVVESGLHRQTVRMVSPMVKGEDGRLRPVLELGPIYVVEQEPLPPPRDLNEVYVRAQRYLKDAWDPADPNRWDLPVGVKDLMVASGVAFFVGWCVGGFVHGRRAERAFKVANRNTIFKHQLLAQREANWAAMEAVFFQGLPNGLKMGTITAMVLGGTSLVDVYRQKESFLHMGVAGGVTGFIFSAPYGFQLCRLATGSSFGFGIVGGLSMSAFKKLEEIMTTDEMRRELNEAMERERHERIGRVLSRYQTTDAVIRNLQQASFNLDEQREEATELVARTEF